MPQNTPLDRIFDDLADSYDHRHHEEIARALIALVAPDEDHVIADVACGAGAVALQLAQSRPATAQPILAIDLSPEMVAVGKTQAARLGCDTAIDWQVADAVPLPVADQSLDVVLCASSLHFLGRRALTDWRRALRQGGQLGFTLPLATRFHPSELFSGHVARDVPLPSTAQEASDWATECGFAQVESRVHAVGTRGVIVTSAVVRD
ncbi:class I SAM-dependent methyltransferase [Streptomyces sp. NPDC001020]